MLILGLVPEQIVGTLPQWLTFGSVTAFLGIMVKWRLGMGKISVEAQEVQVRAKQVANADAADVRDHLTQMVSDLRDELHKCEDECARRMGHAEARVRALEEELWGEKKQRVAEQISLINVILNSVDAPELKSLLRTLESVKTHLQGRDGTGSVGDKPHA